jgi:hypothetical protein
MMFLNCPAYLDQECAVRCGLPAEVRCQFTMHSTDGPLESVMIRCPAGHCFSGPVESLTWDSTGKYDPGPAGAGSRAGRDILQRGHDGRGGSALRAFPAEPEHRGRRPNTAPAYYLGHPASLWITAMRPHRSRAASGYLLEAAVDGGNQSRSRSAAATRRECGRIARAARRPHDAGYALAAGTIPDDHAQAAEQDLLAAERHAALREAFAQLPPGCQQLLALLTGDPALSYAEISARLGIPVGSIGPSRRRCLDKLRRHPAVTALIDAGIWTARM